jgi:hypothetical protein
MPPWSSREKFALNNECKQYRRDQNKSSQKYFSTYICFQYLIGLILFLFSKLEEYFALKHA